MPLLDLVLEDCFVSFFCGYGFHCLFSRGGWLLGRLEPMNGKTGWELFFGFFWLFCLLAVFHFWKHGNALEQHMVQKHEDVHCHRPLFCFYAWLWVFPHMRPVHHRVHLAPLVSIPKIGSRPCVCVFVSWIRVVLNHSTFKLPFFGGGEQEFANRRFPCTSQFRFAKYGPNSHIFPLGWYKSWGTWGMPQTGERLSFGFLRTSQQMATFRDVHPFSRCAFFLRLCIF